MKLLTNSAAIIFALTLTACGNKSMPKIPDGVVDSAKPVYEECVADYKKTMSEKDAQKACTEKLKGAYEKVKK